MDNIYTKHDMAEAIAKVEELARVNAELDELLYRGSNDEKLVEKKYQKLFPFYFSDLDANLLVR